MFGPKLTRLRDLRHRAGYTQDELAERAGLSVRTVGNAERVAARPKVATIEGLAAGLGVEPSELWRSEPDVAAVSAAVNELVTQTLTGPAGGPWVEDQLVKEFRHRLDGEDAAADEVWQNVEDHAGFYSALSALLHINTWASVSGNAPLVKALHDAVKVLVETTWRPLHEENGDKGGEGHAKA